MTRVHTWQLFGLSVLVWGTTWYAITFQVGRVDPEVGVAYRFALASLTILSCARFGKLSVSLPARDHVFVALQGSFMYGLAYLCIYHAERYLPSGIVAVGYSASPLISGLCARLLWSAPLTARFVVGGLLGLCGVALLFWREIAVTSASNETVRGALLTMGGVLLSAVGSLAASRNRERGLSFWPALGWGMGYGAATCAVAAWLKDASFTLPTAPSWWISLLHLSLLGSVVAFACFLKLQERIGPGRAGAVGVMTPVLALTVSIALEGYQADLNTAAGVALALLGNVLMLVQAPARTKSATDAHPLRS
jgi:drug/metabolite transporter (DMT)-like permease